VHYTIAGHQTHHEYMLLNFIAAYSINLRVDICLIHIFVLLVKPVYSLFVYNTQCYIPVV
jgi:hypothetical protein